MPWYFDYGYDFHIIMYHNIYMVLKECDGSIMCKQTGLLATNKVYLYYVPFLVIVRWIIAFSSLIFVRVKFVCFKFIYLAFFHLVQSQSNTAQKNKSHKI